jgi:hypothetical protein
VSGFPQKNRGWSAHDVLNTLAVLHIKVAETRKKLKSFQEYSAGHGRVEVNMRRITREQRGKLSTGSGTSSLGGRLVPAGVLFFRCSPAGFACVGGSDG